MSLYGPNPGPKAKRVPRWGHKAYQSRPRKKSWRPEDEIYLRQSFFEFNNNPDKPYWKFLKEQAYALEKSQDEVRAKLTDLYKRRIIPIRSH